MPTLQMAAGSLPVTEVGVRKGFVTPGRSATLSRCIAVAPVVEKVARDLDYAVSLECDKLRFQRLARASAAWG